VTDANSREWFDAGLLMAENGELLPRVKVHYPVKHLKQLVMVYG